MTTTDMPPYNGEPVTKAAVKFVGVGTGFNGLDVRPVVMELDEDAWFVMHVTASESASHKRDKDGNLVRVQRLHAEDMAPIDRAIAQKALQEYAQQIEDAKARLDGQLRLDEEAAAQDREKLDVTGTPAEVADAAADRAKKP